MGFTLFKRSGASTLGLSQDVIDDYRVNHQLRTNLLSEAKTRWDQASKLDLGSHELRQDFEEALTRIREQACLAENFNAIIGSNNSKEVPGDPVNSAYLNQTKFEFNYPGKEYNDFMEICSGLCEVTDEEAITGVAKALDDYRLYHLSRNKFLAQARELWDTLQTSRSLSQDENEEIHDKIKELTDVAERFKDQAALVFNSLCDGFQPLFTHMACCYEAYVAPQAPRYDRNQSRAVNQQIHEAYELASAEHQAFLDFIGEVTHGVAYSPTMSDSASDDRSSSPLVSFTAIQSTASNSTSTPTSPTPFT